MRVRFQADADLNNDIVRATIRLEPAIDFRTAQQANLTGVDDPDVLRIAAADKRVLVSHDRRTMPTHFGKFIMHEECHGLFIVSQKLSIGRIAEELLLIWAASEPQDWINQMHTLPL